MFVCICRRERLCEDDEPEEEDCEFKLMSDVESLSGQVSPQKSFFLCVCMCVCALLYIFGCLIVSLFLPSGE